LNKDEAFSLSEIYNEREIRGHEHHYKSSIYSALALYKVYSLNVIIPQMQLCNIHMLKSFLTASAISVCLPYGSTKVSFHL